MLRYALVILSAVVLVCTTLVPNEAFARRGGGGFHGGGGYHGAGRAHVSRPIARYPVARTAARRGVYRGAAYGAAAVGAAAAGAAYFGGDNSGCSYDTYGQWVCPNNY
jgi:hypothetical protein